MAHCRAFIVVILAYMLVCGCRRETPLERGMREYRDLQQGRMAMAALETMHLRTMTDAQTVNAYSRNGLGLGIRPQKTELHVGEPLILHVIYTNIATRTAISATTCQGFSLTEEDEATSQSNTAAVSFACPDDPLHDNNVELRPGEVKTAEVTTAGTNLQFNHPGRYRVAIEWQSFRPSDGIYLTQSGYSPLESNPLLITVR